MTAVLVKPCDSYSLNELIRENRVRREQVRILGVPCKGNVDPRALEGKGVLAVREEEEQLMLSTLYGEEILPLSQVLLERCRVCRGKKHAVYDELPIRESPRLYLTAAVISSTAASKSWPKAPARAASSSE